MAMLSPTTSVVVDRSLHEITDTSGKEISTIGGLARGAIALILGDLASKVLFGKFAHSLFLDGTVKNLGSWLIAMGGLASVSTVGYAGKGLVTRGIIEMPSDAEVCARVRASFDNIPDLSKRDLLLVGGIVLSTILATIGVFVHGAKTGKITFPYQQEIVHMFEEAPKIPAGLEQAVSAEPIRQSK